MMTPPRPRERAMQIGSAFALVLAACGQSESPKLRSPVAKADLTGSCQSSDGSAMCGGPSDGNCWCDDLCSAYGDCCTDIGSVCGEPACPSVDDPQVHYVDTDPDVCLAADWACGEHQSAFDDQCGCGCIDQEDSGSDEPTCSLGEPLDACCDFVVSKSGYWKEYMNDPDVCAHRTFGQGVLETGVDDQWFCQLQCAEGEIVVDLTPNLDDFRVGCVAGCEAACPDPDDPSVHYIDDNPHICQAADWVCDEDQTSFDDECGCGCIDKAE